MCTTYDNLQSCVWTRTDSTERNQIAVIIIIVKLQYGETLFDFPHVWLVSFPPGHRHFHDPGGGDQENSQRRVSVLPLQPRTLVKTPPPGHSAGTFCHFSYRKAQTPEGFWPTPCDCLKVTPTHCLWHFHPGDRAKYHFPLWRPSLYLWVSLHFLFIFFPLLFHFQSCQPWRPEAWPSL